MDAPVGEFGWPNAQGYVVEMEVGFGQYVEIDLDVLLGFSALPFYASPLPAAFVAAPPVPAPFLPVDLAGAVAAINHGVDDFENIDDDVLYGFAAMPFYGVALPVDFFAAPPPAHPAADLAVPAMQHGFDNFQDLNDEAQLGADLPADDVAVPHDFILPNDDDNNKIPWNEVASLKLHRAAP